MPAAKVLEQRFVAAYCFQHLKGVTQKLKSVGLVILTKNSLGGVLEDPIVSVSYRFDGVKKCRIHLRPSSPPL